MKIAIVLGTRPEIIKMSPLVRRLQKIKADFFLIHTGQHYSFNMDKIFFKELNLLKPKYNLEVGSLSHGLMTAKILEKIEPILIKEKPDVVLVQGDTNSVLAGALASVKLGIKVGHVEAGLRSYDRTMPEELNRIMTDHISDFLFCPTKESAGLILKEGIEKQKIFVTGNTIVDAVFENLKLATKRKEIFNKLKIKFGNYFLLTAHRQENVDQIEKLKSIIKGLIKVSDFYKLPIIWPIHPRTADRIKKFKIKLPPNIILTEPIGYLDFLLLESKAKLILTDSGGLQEEAVILKVPCVTLRENTERPETVEVGGNILVGTDDKKILAGAKKMLAKKKNWKNPFGDGKTAEKIITILRQKND